MKFRLIITSLLCLAGLLSCQKGGGEASDSFVVSPQQFSIASEGGSVSFSITSISEDWVVRSAQSWAKPSPVSGKAGASAVTVTVSVDENTATAAREAVITVKTLGGSSREVKLTQAAGSGEQTKHGISSAADLMGFAKALSEGGAVSKYLVNGTAMLLCDIDASSLTEWIPIGTSERPLTYGFDGDGHKITGLNVTVDLSKYADAGFIGYAKASLIDDLTLEGTLTFTGTPSSDANVGGVVGKASAVMMTEVNCALTLKVPATLSGSSAVGGLCGRTDASCTLGDDKNKSWGSIFSGTLLCASSCYEGGFAGYNEGEICNCTCKGAVLGKSSSDLGPGWGCGYNKTSANFASNFGYGFVGDYDTFKDNPSGARPSVYSNCMVGNNFDLEANTVDQTLDTYYDWETVSTLNVALGVTYTHYNCTGVPRHIHVLQVDLSNPNVEVTTSYAEDCVPNPNGNKNSNNGKNIRETLSELCTRMRSEGVNIVAGTNSGFFDSNDGISRGATIQDGEMIYYSQPIWTSLVNHRWALTVFTDGTASCGKKTFSGKLKAAGKEYVWYSVNDTLMRHKSAACPVNIYTSRYKQYPHPEKTTLTNNLASDVLYLVAEYTSDVMKVNCGYAEARVKAIYDGRSSALATLPYLTSAKEVGVSLSGTQATEIGTAVKVGDVISLKCDATIDGVTKPVLTQNSSMYQPLMNGQDNSSSVGGTEYYPSTFPVVSQDGKTLWLVEIDGRQGWYSTGVLPYEQYRIAKKLGGWNSTRFDGGGSATMWVYDSGSSRGSVVNRVCDSKGERSCLNYMLIKVK